MSFSSVSDKIFIKMTGGELKDACVLMMAAVEVFPDLMVQRQAAAGGDDQEEEEELPAPTTLDALQNLFHGECSSSQCFLLTLSPPNKTVGCYISHLLQLSKCFFVA